MKSDDVMGRVRTYEAIIKGENIPKPSIPESFKVLLKELQSLCLDIKVLRDDNTEITIGESLEEADKTIQQMLEAEKAPAGDEDLGSYGYGTQELQGEEFVYVEDEVVEEE